MPDKGHVTTRNYGWDANRPRGMQDKPHRQAQRFANDGRAGEVFFCHRAIRLHHETHCFSEIHARLFKRGTLRVRARKFFDERDEAFRHGLIDGSQLDGHRTTSRRRGR